MSEGVKTFLIEGEVKMGMFKQKFSKKTRALRPEDALERVYSTLGSKHKVKRDQITIKNVIELEEEAVGSSA